MGVLLRGETNRISVRPDPASRWPLTGSRACLRPAFDQWRAELKAAEASRRLPLAWPLPEWLGDYSDLLVAALGRPDGTGRSALRARSWTAEIQDFLELMLADRDGAAAQLVRTLTRRYPFADELRRLQRVQALFAFIRPARNLAEALEAGVLAPEAAYPATACAR